MTNKYYLFIVRGDIEPYIEGPFRSNVKRNAFAKQHRADHGDDDGIYWFDMDSTGGMDVGSYSGGYLDGDEE